MKKLLLLLVALSAVLMTPPGSRADSIKSAPYSLHPPAGLDPTSVPQFVVFGFDDNAFSGLEGSKGDGGMKWVLDLFRDKENPDSDTTGDAFGGEPCRVSFYLVGAYAGPGAFEKSALVRQSWRQAWLDGHEMGNHTYSHSDDLAFNTSEKVWSEDIQKCNAVLTSVCQPDPDSRENSRNQKLEIRGFRTPFLAYTYETFSVIKKDKFLYDCSIEDGWQKDQDGADFCWPYTLDNGSPGDAVIWKLPEVKRLRPLGHYAGLWEFPQHPVIVPPDDECPRYGVPAGLRKTVKRKYPWFDEASDKLPGMDYNLYFDCKLTREEVLAILKYTFDLHYNGNRAPLSIGSHSDIYSSKYPMNHVPTTYRDRQWVLEQFVNYILTKPDVRIVPAYKVIDWCRNPRPLRSFGDQDWLAPVMTDLRDHGSDRSVLSR